MTNKSTAKGLTEQSIDHMNELSEQHARIVRREAEDGLKSARAISALGEDMSEIELGYQSILDECAAPKKIIFSEEILTPKGFAAFQEGCEAAHAQRLAILERVSAVKKLVLEKGEQIKARLLAMKMSGNTRGNA